MESLYVRFIFVNLEFAFEKMFRVRGGSAVLEGIRRRRGRLVG